jgi:hypothetical protein
MIGKNFMATSDKHVIGAYLLLLKQKQSITWKDILVTQRDSLPEDGIPFDASLWNSAKQLVAALEKNESVFK